MDGHTVQKIVPVALSEAVLFFYVLYGFNIFLERMEEFQKNH